MHPTSSLLSGSGPLRPALGPYPPAQATSGPSGRVRPPVPRAHPGVAALPILGAAVGAIALMDQDDVLLPIRSLVVLAGAVLGAWVSLGLIRWEPDDRAPLR